jgi:hypothetical protein
MDQRDAIHTHCPSCASGTGVVYAASAARDAAKPISRLLDVRLPARALWSGLWGCSAGCFVLGVVAWLINASTGWLDAADIFVVFGVTFGCLGVWQTRVNRRRMRGVEAMVHRLHESALYCSSCECVYFDMAKPPAGIAAGRAIAVREYRRMLWYACGFTKPI